MKSTKIPGCYHLENKLNDSNNHFFLFYDPYETYFLYDYRILNVISNQTSLKYIYVKLF